MAVLREDQNMAQKGLRRNIKGIRYEKSKTKEEDSVTGSEI
jgi:hypothetical protein